MPRPPRIPFFAIVASDFWTNAKVFETTPDGVLVFFFALTQNAKRGRTGRFPASDLAPRLVSHLVFRDLDEQRAKAAIASTISARLLDVAEDEVFVCGWDEEWQRDELNAQQALVRAKYRTEKQKEIEKQTKKQIEKERSGDVVATTEDVVMTTEKRPRRKPETAIGDWRPSEASPELEIEFQRFRNHALQNDRRCRDWSAAFRNWLISPHRKPSKSAPGSSRPHADYDEAEHPRDFGA